MWVAELEGKKIKGFRSRGRVEDVHDAPAEEGPDGGLDGSIRGMASALAEQFESAAGWAATSKCIGGCERHAKLALALSAAGVHVD